MTTLFCTQESFAAKQNLENKVEENLSEQISKINHNSTWPDKKDPCDAGLDSLQNICVFCSTNTLLNLRLTNEACSTASTVELRNRYNKPKFIPLPTNLSAKLNITDVTDVVWNGGDVKLLCYDSKGEQDVSSYVFFLYNISNNSYRNISDILRDKLSGKKILGYAFSADGTILAGNIIDENTKVEQGFLINISDTGFFGKVEIIETQGDNLIRGIKTFERKTKTLFGVEKHLTNGKPEYHLFKWTSQNGFETLFNSKIDDVDIPTMPDDMPTDDQNFIKGFGMSMVSTYNSKNKEEMVALNLTPKGSSYSYHSYLWTPQQGLKKNNFNLQGIKGSHVRNINSTGAIFGQVSIADSDASPLLVYIPKLQRTMLLPYKKDETNTAALCPGPSYASEDMNIIADGVSQKALLWLKTPWGGIHPDKSGRFAL